PAERFSDPLSMLAAFRAALRDTAAIAAVEVGDAAAILVTVRETAGALDEALLGDLEAVLPAAERALAAAGFALALDLGASAVFARSHCSSEDAVATALAVWDQLAARPLRAARVRVGMCAPRARAAMRGSASGGASTARPPRFTATTSGQARCCVRRAGASPMTSR